MGNNARMMKVPNQTPASADIAPSHFIIKAIETGVKKIVPNSSMSFQNDPRGTVHLALKYSWHRLQQETEPDDSDLLKIAEPEQNVVRAQVGEQLRNNQIPLTSTTSLTNVARSIVIRKMVQRILAQNPQSHLLTEVEKRGIVASQSDINDALMQITNTTNIDTAMRTINNVCSQDIPSPTEVGPVEIFNSWISEQARKLHDYALCINQPVAHTKVAKITMQQTLGAVGEKISGSIGKIFSAVKSGVINALEHQSSQAEGLRTRLAQLLTGKMPIRFLLGLATLNTNNPSSHSMPPEKINKSVPREIGQSHGEITISNQNDSVDLSQWHREKAQEAAIASAQDWIDKVHTMTHLPTPVIDMVTGEIHGYLSTNGIPMTDIILGQLIQDALEKHTANLAQDKREGFERANEMLLRIEAQKRGAIQQAGGIDPNRGGAKMVQAFTQLPENGNPAKIQEIMNKEGIFA